MTRRASLAAFVLLALATVSMILWAVFIMWRTALDSTLDFGLDLVAYTSAAKRLAETGSPYSAELLRGPIINTAANVPIAYYYPPPLAQAFLPLADVSQTLLATVWTVAQICVFLWLIPALFRAGGGQLTPLAAVALLFVCAASWPFNEALFIGNVSGWYAAAIGCLLLTTGRIAGCLSAVMAFVKLTPVTFLGAALVDRRTRGAAVVTTLLIVGVSMVLAPSAWIDWLRILPNLLRLEPSDASANLAPVAVFGLFGLSRLGTIVGLVLAAGFGISALILASREGMGPRTIAAAAFGSMFLSSTLWEHYLAVIIPLIVFAWAGADALRRGLITAYVAIGISDWFVIAGYEWQRLLTLIVVIALGVDLSLRAWPARPDEQGEPVTAAGPRVALFGRLRRRAA